MFVGRQRELKKLERLYKSDQFEFAVFYGRRRVGKTTLINEFIKDKDAVYYMAIEGTRKENLAGLSKALLQSHITAGGLEFSDFNGLFDYIDSQCLKQGRLIIVIDEFPYLAASYPAISSILQSHIDQHWKNSMLFLILCGSSMSFMEEQVLGYKSPLYGRRTAQFKLHPFTYFEARKMLKGFSEEEQAILYGITGGIPEYLARIDSTVSLDQNIIDAFFDESGRLFEEPANLLKQELREPASYHSIISAIANGASRINEISTKTGLETSAASNLITSLITLGIVKREIPITENQSSRKTRYQLEDSMFLFWYRFVRPNISSITRGVGEHVYTSLVKPHISDFMGAVFEAICKQYLYLPKIYARLPFPLGSTGRWWGNNPIKKCQEEIDIMAIHDSSALFGECKWRNSPVDTEVISTLKERGALFHYTENYFIIFSKGGFTDSAIETAAGEDGISLVSFEEMNQYDL